MRKLQAILVSALLASLLTGCIVVERPYHGGYGYWHYDRDHW